MANNELDFLRQFAGDTNTPVENVSAKPTNLDALKRMQEALRSQAQDASALPNFEMQGSPYGGNEAVPVGKSYSPIDQANPMAGVNEKRVAGSLQQTLPDAGDLGIEKFPNQADEIRSLLQKTPDAGGFSFNNQMDMLPTPKELPLNVSNSLSKHGQVPQKVGALNITQPKPSITEMPDVVKQGMSYGKAFKDVGSAATNSSDNLERMLARQELMNALKSGGANALKGLKNTVTSPTALAGLASGAAMLPAEMVASQTGNTADPFASKDAAAAEGSDERKLEDGTKLFPFNGKPTDDKSLAGSMKGTMSPGDLAGAFAGQKDEGVRQPAETHTVEEQAQEVASKVKAGLENPERSIAKANHEAAKAEAAMKKPDATDTEMEAAMAQRDRNLFFGRLMTAANDFGAALGGANAQILKADNTIANDIIGRADQPVKDVNTKRESMAKKMELDREKAKNNSASPISQLYREALFKVAPELAKDPRYAQMSAYDAEKAFPAITGAFNAVESREARLQADKQRAEDRQLHRDMMLNGKQQLQLSSFHKSFNDSLNKLDAEKEKTNAQLDEADALATSATTSPQAAQSLAKAIVKAVEGAGAKVSDKDVSGALAAGGVSKDAIAWLQKRGSGTIPSFQRDDIKKMLVVMRDVHNQAFENRKEQMVHRQSKLTGRSPEQIKDESFIEPSKTSQVKQAAPKIDRALTNDEVTAYAKKNNRSVEEAKAFLKQNGYNVE